MALNLKDYSMKVLEGKVAVVTGGMRGIGFAIAEALVDAGARVALLDVSSDVLKSANNLSNAKDAADVLGVTADVTDEPSVEQAIDQVEAQLGVPDVLVNSAGIANGDSALTIDLNEWRRVFSINVEGTLICSRSVAKRAIAANRSASIINISSISAFAVNVPQDQTAYNASKAAVAMMTSSLAIEWAPRGIRVNAIAPGYMATEMAREFAERQPDLYETWLQRIPLGRFGQPSELGAIAVFLASDQASYVLGENIRVDGGYTVV